MLRRLPADSAQTCVTSPPYWGLRDYGVKPSLWGGDEACQHAVGEELVIDPRDHKPGRESEFKDRKTTNARRKRGTGGAFCTKCGAWRGCLGLEPTPKLFCEHLVEVFREVRRVLRPDGTTWVNLGDTYFSRPNGSVGKTTLEGSRNSAVEFRRAHALRKHARVPGLKHKDLVGIPWMVAFALRDDGWYLRSEVIWKKLSPMPESVLDRPSRSHEQIFLLAKSRHYFYDREAIREPLAPHTFSTYGTTRKSKGNDALGKVKADKFTKSLPTRQPALNEEGQPRGANKRSVWSVATQPYDGAHFAVFPPKLIEPCVLAGTSARGCCAACGAPFRRLVVIPKPPRAPGATVKRNARDGGLTADHGLNRTGMSHNALAKWRRQHPPQTVGWSPGCACDAGTAPCLVLDPFAGAGTAWLVASQLGRRFVGTEISPAYAAMATERVRADAPLFTLLPAPVKVAG
jgi:DNA modification methylase